MATELQIKAFIALMAPIIQAEAAARGYNYPSAIIAQACVESAFGTSQLGYKYHNYFGMKCGSSWKGKSVNLKTKEEYTQGNLTTISDNFRVYDNERAGVVGYFDFISKPRYQNLKSATSARNYLELIKEDGYATSFKYVETVNSYIEKYDLTRYDTFEPVSELKGPDPGIVDRVINLEFGSGAARIAALNEAGYEYQSVQKKVNEVCGCIGQLKALKTEYGEYFSVALNHC